jgi:cytochrome P450 PksS
MRIRHALDKEAFPMTTTNPHTHTAGLPDIASPAFKSNPWPACAHLRAEQPVVRMRVRVHTDMQEAYLVMRYEDAAAVLRDERFVKDVRGARDPRELRLPWMPRAVKPLAHTILDSDGDEHRRLRALVRDTFAPRHIAELEPRVRELVGELLDRMAGARNVDLVADYALPLPLTVISEILGVPERDRLRFRRWFSSLVGVSASSRPSLSLLTKLPSVFAMMRFLRHLVVERQAHPGDDLVSRLANAREEGDRLTEDELVAMVGVLLIAGYETTVNLIATGTLLLLAHPEQLAQLREEPALIGPAVEELLRLATPVDVATERYAREDVEIAGVTIPRGSLILVAIVSANADAAHFPDPERLDLTRAENRHLAFGLGPHYCLGAPLARMEGRIAIESLIQRFPHLRLAVPSEQLRWRPGVSLRGLTSLPVSL